uniref:Uncharacterized protein n=1 Tax=Astyanax mexicanus TaxID=7994 RepID=A0A3B1IBV6_ASTMX
MAIRRPLWLTVRSYLTDRVQRIQWGSCISEPYAIPSGVPQGGLLSPLLFVICINKLLMGSLPGLTQKALDSVADWGQEFSLTMNGAKTKDMVISARRQDNIPSPPSPIISGQNISRVTTFKLLGHKIGSAVRVKTAAAKM